jgi:hypothetical protein
MADTQTPTPDQTGFPDAGENNKKVADQLESQDINGKSNAPTAEVHKATGDVLDALLKEKEQAANEGDETAKKAAAEKAEADKKAAEEKAKQEAEANDPAKKAEREAAEKAAAEKATAEKSKADDLFKDSPALPPNASPKSSEAFAAIKLKATQEVSARDQRISELEAKNKELEEKVNTTKAVTPEVERELKTLREWQAKLDVELDPKFKEYTKTIETDREFIYAQLRKSPLVTDKVIEKIKSHGGPENVQLEKIFAEIGDKTIQTLVESKIASIETAKFNRDQAIKAAKENISGYMADREKQWQQSATQHNDDTKSILEKDLLPKLDYLKTQSVKPGADEATKKAVEAHNKWVGETLGLVNAALADDSPDMRAVMIVGMAQLLHLKPQLAAAETKVAKLEKELAEANQKIAEFKGASVSRLRESAVPPGGKLPEAKQTENDIFNTRAGDALDKIAAGIQEERARAAGAGR